MPIHRQFPLNFAAFNNLSATSEDSIRNLFVSPWYLTWLQMMHSLSLGSGDVIVSDLFGQVTGDVNGEKSALQTNPLRQILLFFFEAIA